MDWRKEGSFTTLTFLRSVVTFMLMLLSTMTNGDLMFTPLPPLGFFALRRNSTALGDGWTELVDDAWSISDAPSEYFERAPRFLRGSFSKGVFTAPLSGLYLLSLAASVRQLVGDFKLDISTNGVLSRSCFAKASSTTSRPLHTFRLTEIRHLRAGSSISSAIYHSGPEVQSPVLEAGSILTVIYLQDPKPDKDIFYVSTSMEYERLSRNCDNLQGNSPPDFRPMVNTSPYLTTSPAVSSSSVTANVDDIPLPTDVMFHLNKDMEEIQSESKNRLPDERVLDAGILSSDLGADSSNQGLEEASGVKASDKDGGVRVLKLHPDPRQILKLGVISNPTTSDSSTAIVKELRSTVSSVNDTVFFQNIFYASVNSTAPVGSHICILNTTADSENRSISVVLNISQADALDGYIGIAANATVFVKMSPIPGLEPHKMITVLAIDGASNIILDTAILNLTVIQTGEGANVTAILETKGENLLMIGALSAMSVVIVFLVFGAVIVIRDLRTALRDRQSCEEKADEDDDQIISGTLQLDTTDGDMDVRPARSEYRRLSDDGVASEDVQRLQKSVEALEHNVGLVQTELRELKSRLGTDWRSRASLEGFQRKLELEVWYWDKHVHHINSILAEVPQNSAASSLSDLDEESDTDEVVSKE